MDDMMERILRQTGCEDLISRLSGLPAADLHSLMLAIYAMEAEKTSPGTLLGKAAANRFIQPSGLDPVRYHRLEADLLSLAKGLGIKPLLLSPAAPLGSCSAFGAVHQNKIISAARGLEMMADPTNALALNMALERSKGRGEEDTHLCASARVMRAQPVSGKRSFAHFGIFCIVSGGRDRGNFLCEEALLGAHLRFYQAMAQQFCGASLSLTLNRRGGYADRFVNHMLDTVSRDMPGVPLTLNSEDNGSAYYRGLNFKLHIRMEEELIELGDGGFVDWTQRMTGNQKERCLISGIGLDRLLMLSDNRANGA